ncbi:MAG: HprK-related kinase A [Pseudomonadota bacterium]
MPAAQLNSLSPREIRQLLDSPRGLRFDIGPFRVCVHSRLTGIAAHVHEMYGHYPLADSDYADLHFAVDVPAGLHGLLRRQVNFRFDDEFPFKPLPFAQARPFFEWGLNWCIATTAHQYLIIHAAVVAKGDHCALIPGRPGAGKSTLCAALVASGWRLLSDEMALIALDTGLIWPVPRPVSLKNASIDIIRGRHPEVVLSPSFTDTHKGTVAHMRAPDASVSAAGRAARARWVVYPGYQSGAATEVGPVTPCQSTLRLADDSFNLPLLGGRGFEVLAEVASQCSSFTLRYSSLDEAIAWFDAQAEACRA